MSNARPKKFFFLNDYSKEPFILDVIDFALKPKNRAKIWFYCFFFYIRSISAFLHMQN